MSRTTASEIGEQDIEVDSIEEWRSIDRQMETQAGAGHSGPTVEDPEFDMPRSWAPSKFIRGPWREGRVTIYQGDLLSCPFPRNQGERVYVLNPANPSLAQGSLELLEIGSLH